MAQKQHQPSKKDEAQIEEMPQGVKKDEELEAETDDLLDEIDDVLESNAEDFVKAFIQKGGE